MINWHPKNLIDSLLPYVTLHAIIGHGVFNDTTGRSRQCFSVAYVITFSIAYLAAYYYAVKIAWYANWKAVEETVAVYAASINAGIWMFSGFFSWCHHTKYATCIKRLSAIDESLLDLGEHTDYEALFRWGLGFMAVSLLAIVTTTATDGISLIGKTSIGEILFLAFVFHYPTHANSIFVFNYSVAIRAVSTRLAKINRVLDRISTMPMMDNSNDSYRKSTRKQNVALSNAITVSMPTWYCYIDGSTVPNQPKYLIQIVKQIHLELWSIAKEIERICSVQTTLELTSNFVTLSSLLYNIYSTITTPLQADRITRLTAMCCWFTIYSAKLLFINCSCGRAATEDRKAGIIIYGLTMDNGDRELNDEIFQYSLQLMVHRLFIRPGGFFTLGYKFVTKFLTTMITYVVIVIEMSSVRRQDR